LHENRIKTINLKSISNVKVVNLSSNLIEVLEVTCKMPNLVELNLRRNQISDVKDLDLPELKKLYLSGNKITSMDAIKALPLLTDLTLDNNPIDKTPGLGVALKEKFPSLIHYNLLKLTDGSLETLADKTNEKITHTPLGLTPDILASARGKENRNIKSSGIKGLNSSMPVLQPPAKREMPVKIELPTFKPKNECNVVKIIQKEWDREVERLNARKA
jgi:Leucine-rich repeat (LRR) protein